MELNDTTDYQKCFVCGQNNPYGLHMKFRLEDDKVVADFLPAPEHQGFPGVIHGGIVAAVLDEALNRTTMLTTHPTWTMTGRLEVRYRRYVPFGQLLRVRASLGKERGRLILASGVLTLAAEQETILAEASGTFMALTAEMVSEITREYPQMEHFFDK